MFKLASGKDGDQLLQEGSQMEKLRPIFHRTPILSIITGHIDEVLQERSAGFDKFPRPLEGGRRSFMLTSIAKQCKSAGFPVKQCKTNLIDKWELRHFLVMISIFPGVIHKVPIFIINLTTVLALWFRHLYPFLCSQKQHYHVRDSYPCVLLKWLPMSLTVPMAQQTATHRIRLPFPFRISQNRTISHQNCPPIRCTRNPNCPIKRHARSSVPAW